LVETKHGIGFLTLIARHIVLTSAQETHLSAHPAATPSPQMKPQQEPKNESSFDLRGCLRTVAPTSLAHTQFCCPCTGACRVPATTPMWMSKSTRVVMDQLADKQISYGSHRIQIAPFHTSAPPLLLLASNARKEDERRSSLRICYPPPPRPVLQTDQACLHSSPTSLRVVQVRPMI